MFGNLWRKNRAASKQRKEDRLREEEREKRIQELREHALADMAEQKARLLKKKEG